MTETTVSNRFARNVLSIAMVFAVAAPLMGCGNQLDCSADETRQLIYQIAGKRYRDIFALPDDWTHPDLKFSLVDIITREKGQNKAVCAATLHLTGPADPQGKASFIPGPRVVERDNEITYQLERTDDGRLYARMYGF